MRPAAIVLAGGASSRFGANKLAAPLAGRPVLEHALRAAAAVANPVVLVLGPDDPVPSLPAELGAVVVLARDAVAYRGPLAGLATGLAALPRPVDVAIVVAGDMPTLLPAVLELLVGVLVRKPSLGAACLETEPVSPLPAAVRPSVAGPAAEALLAADRRSLRGLLDAVPTVFVPAAAWRALDPDGATLRDVDTPGDLAGRDLIGR
jgi:molybdopterin-guanine dinucleotide biosynthesis protein A